MLKLCVTGKPKELDHFMNDFKAQPQYNVIPDPKASDNLSSNETKVFVNVDYNPTQRKPLLVKLTTSTGKIIEINLLDGIVAELDLGLTIVSGKVFDVFG